MLQRTNRGSRRNTKSSGGEAGDANAAYFKKRPEERDDDDINMILDLVKGVKFFEELSLDMRFSVCRVMHYFALGKNQVVFRQGEEGNTFYVVLRGSVDVLVRHRGVRFTACSLYPGHSFGELSLINSAPRSATVRTTMPSEFLVIARTTTTLCLRKSISMLSEKKLSLLRRVHSFCEWSEDDLVALAEKAQVRKFSDNGIVCARKGKSASIFTWSSEACAACSRWCRRARWQTTIKALRG